MPEEQPTIFEPTKAEDYGTVQQAVYAATDHYLVTASDIREMAQVLTNDDAGVWSDLPHKVYTAAARIVENDYEPTLRNGKIPFRLWVTLVFKRLERRLGAEDLNLVDYDFHSDWEAGMSITEMVAELEPSYRKMLAGA